MSGVDVLSGGAIEYICGVERPMVIPTVAMAMKIDGVVNTTTYDEYSYDDMAVMVAWSGE